MTTFLSKIKLKIVDYRGLGYVTLSNVTANGIGGIFWIMLATIVTTEVYGQVNYFLFVAGLASTVAALGFPLFLTTFSAKGLLDILQRSAGIILVLSICASIISLLIFQFTPLAVLVLGMTLFIVSTGYMIGSGRYREYAIAIIGQRAVSFGLSIGLYFLIGAEGIIYGFALSNLVFGYQVILNLKKSSFSYSVIKERHAFLLHSWGMDVSKTFAQTSDKFLIAPVYGFAVLGIYQLGVQFLSLQAIIPGIMFTYLLREEAAGKNRKHVKVIGVAVSLLLSAVIFTLSPTLVPVLFPKFLESIPLIQIATWGAPLMAYNAVLSSELLAKEKTKIVLITTAIFVAVVYSSMLILGAILGPSGLIYGLLLGLGSETIYMYASKRQLFKGSSSARSGNII